MMDLEAVLPTCFARIRVVHVYHSKVLCNVPPVVNPCEDSRFMRLGGCGILAKFFIVA